MPTFSELMQQDHECPECHKLMLLQMSDEVLMSDPPQWPTYWRCGCGYRRPAGNMTSRQESADDRFMRQWEAINR